MIQYQVDLDKALEVLMYVARHESDMYRLLKYLYLADRLSLSRNARLLYGERYSRLPKGPVADYAYNMIRHANPHPALAPHHPMPPAFIEKLNASISVEGNTITVRREPDLRYLSRADCGVLDEIITEFGRVRNLPRFVHDSAWESVPDKAEIPLENIIEGLDNSAEVKEYIYG